MNALVVFHGSVQEAIELAQAVSHNCDCLATGHRCSAHAAMLSQRWVDGLLFARYLVKRMKPEEFKSTNRGSASR